jgi:hypothetical protein
MASLCIPNYLKHCRGPRTGHHCPTHAWMHYNQPCIPVSFASCQICLTVSTEYTVHSMPITKEALLPSFWNVMSPFLKFFWWTLRSLGRFGFTWLFHRLLCFVHATVLPHRHYYSNCPYTLDKIVQHKGSVVKKTVSWGLYHLQHRSLVYKWIDDLQKQHKSLFPQYWVTGWNVFYEGICTLCAEIMHIPLFFCLCCVFKPRNSTLKTETYATDSCCFCSQCKLADLVSRMTTFKYCVLKFNTFPLLHYTYTKSVMPVWILCTQPSAPTPPKSCYSNMLYYSNEIMHY